MANECINQLIMNGDRSDLINLFMDSDLNFKENKIYEINPGSFCIMFISDWDPPEDFFIELSIKHPKIEFELYYVDKLSQRAGKIIFEAGKKITRTKTLNIPLSELNQPISPEIFHDL